MSDSKKVYGAIASLIAELAESGIKKDRKNAAQGFMFRGVDDIYNALAPLLAKHKLCMLPRMSERVLTERSSAKGGTLMCVSVKVEYDLVSAEDGSMHTISTYGEAMDTGDKATNKAMSSAYKYAAFQAFCIPTEEADADEENHQVQGRELVDTDTIGQVRAAIADLASYGSQMTEESALGWICDKHHIRASRLGELPKENASFLLTQLRTWLSNAKKKAEQAPQ